MQTLLLLIIGIESFLENKNLCTEQLKTFTMSNVLFGARDFHVCQTYGNNSKLLLNTLQEEHSFRTGAGIVL